MDEARRREARFRQNQLFLRRLLARRARQEAGGGPALERAAASTGPTLDELRVAAEGPRTPAAERLLETIVSDERPVLFVHDGWLNPREVTIIGLEAQDLVDNLMAQRGQLAPFLPLIGRIDVTNFPGLDYVGTGWFVAPDVVVTNRHVASLIAEWDGRKYAFSPGTGGNQISASLCNAHEFDDAEATPQQTFAVVDVLYIEPDSGPDIAFLKVARRASESTPNFITVADSDASEDTRVVVVGYPARASRRIIPDQDLMKRLYLDRYDVKRAAPGFTMRSEQGAITHDCTTMGGNSGSVVLDMSGRAVGLHFAGLYQEANFAVPASVLADYVDRKRWNIPRIETSTVPASKPRSSSAVIDQAPQPAGGCSTTFTLPLSITVSIGSPTVNAVSAAVQQAAPRVNLGMAETAAKSFWDQRPDGVIAVRVGFDDEGNEIGDAPVIAASVPASRLDEVRASAPARFQGVPVRYYAAEISEQIDSWPVLEAVDSIAYDDDARTGDEFSLDTIEEQMSVTAHVGPEYSWSVLRSFLQSAGNELVSAMYEFHGKEIADVIEARLDAGVSLELVIDNATFIKVQHEEEEFDRPARFDAWERSGAQFKRIIAPEGTSGLIANSYHMKVTVRDGDSFWLSSGNWKQTSSQPVITQAQLDNAADEDLPGNREWHVTIANATLATRLCNHIRQDFERSVELGGRKLPKRLDSEDILVDVPVTEAALVEERPPPSRVLKPKKFEGRIKVRPLLTPDREGEVYSEAVLKLIRSARRSLLFQIPYISMPSSPSADRGYIDELIAALIAKLKSLPDARVLLRSQGQKYSSPTHVAWYLKSKGVDIRNRLRRIEDHHTKGMIVDGKRLLLGSHNWSQPGVTLNRDASLLFDHPGLADYYAEAFEIDWQRAKPIAPKRFVASETVVLEARGAVPPVGYRRMLLSEVLKDED